MIRQPVPIELDEESKAALEAPNTAAFLLNCGWAIMNRIPNQGIISCVLFVFSAMLISLTDPWSSGPTLILAFPCVVGILMHCCYLFFSGNKLLWATGRFTSIIEMKKSQRKWMFPSIGCSMLVYMMFFGSIAMYAHSVKTFGPGNHYISRFRGCRVHLYVVSNRLSDYLALKGDPERIDRYGEVLCSMLPYRNAYGDSCKGKMKEFAEQFCVTETFKIKVDGPDRYEVSARSNDERYKCAICATEKGVYPESYSECKKNAEPVCKH